jgi:hypothetical protein
MLYRKDALSNCANSTALPMLKVRLEGCGVGDNGLPAQDSLAEQPWMGLPLVIGTILQLT